jgi:hypothetical protein
MVVGQATGDKASEQGVDVWYVVGRERFHLRTNVTMIGVAANRNCGD